MKVRKDNKGRILRQGESQRPDGRYVFKYVGADGNTRYKYSNTLTTHDPAPAGKKDGPCLRELERQVQLELLDSISPNTMTVLELAERYTSTRVGVRENTKMGYKTVLNFLRKDDFGNRKACSVTSLEAREWLIYLQRDKGKSYSSIHTIRGVLRPAFEIAVLDGAIRRNPFDFQLVQVLVNDSVTREALTPAQERRFLEFVKNDSHFCRYYDGILILFKTGLRISEFCGLTLDDINLEEGCFDVNRQLQRSSDMRYYIEQPKSKNGLRRLPMTSEVKEAFGRIIAARKTPEEEPEVDGVSGFLFLDKNGMPMVALHWEKYFQHAREKHNKIYREQLPLITPHVCRHTYCTRIVANGVSAPKVMYLMGHSSADFSYQNYTHLQYEDVREISEELEKNGL